MTKQDAQRIIAEEIAVWCNEFAAEYVGYNGFDAEDEPELAEAFDLVGFDFDWNVAVTVGGN